MKKIEINTWKRKEIYDFFIKSKHPFFGTSFNVDVTNAYNFSKQNNLSFYMVLIWCVTQSINSIDDFLYYQDNENNIYKLDKRIPSFTDINYTDTNNNLFKIVTVNIDQDIINFSKTAKQISNNQNVFIDYSKEDNNLIYISCLPWLDITSIHSEGLDNNLDTIPRITWGKYQKQDNKIIINLTIEVNHAFIDGVHIGLFKTKLDELINNIE